MAERTAIEKALQTLRARDRSAAELASRLQHGGVEEAEQRETLELLSRLGYVDDERLATLRAAALAARGCGDAMIRDDLERRGIAAGTIEVAIGELEPQLERAEQIVARRGRGAKTARFLAARGFDEDAIGAAVAWADAEGVG